MLANVLNLLAPDGWGVHEHQRTLVYAELEFRNRAGPYRRGT